MPTPIRVCYLIDDLSEAGTEKHLLSLIRNFHGSEVRPHLCLLRGDAPRSRVLEPKTCPVLRLGLHSIIDPMSPIKMVQLSFFLWYYRIDILQMYFPDSSFVGFVSGLLVRVPRLVLTRNNLGYSVSPFEKRMSFLYRRFTHATVANCRACLASLAEQPGSPPPGNVAVIENGVDLTRFEIARRPRAALTIGLVANLRPVKNPSLFVAAAALVARQHADVKFVIAGEGELRPQLQKEIHEYGLTGRCTLLGRVDDVPQLLARLDIGVLCSHSEGMSNAILEYMAAGVAVVATAVGGNKDLIDHGVTGFLVPPNDAGALAHTLADLVTNFDLRGRVGKAARQYVRQQFSHLRVVKRYAQFYARLLQSHNVSL